MNATMVDTRDVILALKKVKKERGLSLDKIVSLMEQNGEYVSKTTLSRVFAKGSEEQLFRYETTLRPIASVLLDENIEVDDDTNTKGIKAILKLKKDIIDSLETKIKTVESEEKEKYRAKLEKETEKFQRSLDFVRNQIELKDKRIDHLLDENMKLVEANMKLLHQFLQCPLKNGECNEK